MKKLKAIALDDDDRPLNTLKYFLEKIEFIELLAAENTLEEAERKILFYKPDILFLDININKQLVFPMLDNLKKIKGFNFYIIFLTAHHDGYLRNAVDACEAQYKYAYLHKPLNPDKLNPLLAKIHEELSTRDKSEYETGTLTIVNKGKFHILPFNKILYCESGNNLCILYSESQIGINKTIMTSTLSDLEKQLPHGHFFRMSNQFIVNKKKVAMAGYSQKNKYICSLKKMDGEKINLPIPEKKWKAFRAEFGVG